jgi:hypothetical protein
MILALFPESLIGISLEAIMDELLMIELLLMPYEAS